MSLQIDLLCLFGGLIGLVIGWQVCGYVFGTLALLLKSCFKPSGQRWLYVKQVLVIAPDAWFDPFMTFGPFGMLILLFTLVIRFDPFQERDSADLADFQKRTKLSVEQWVTHGWRDMSDRRRQQELKQADQRLEQIRTTVAAVPQQVSYWAQVSAYWTRKWAAVTAATACILAFVRTGVVVAAETVSSAGTAVAAQYADTTKKSGPGAADTCQPDLKLSGFAIVGLEATPHSGLSPEATVTLNKVRAIAKYRHGQWQSMVVVDPEHPLPVRVAEIGYDMDPKFMVKMGRMLTPIWRLHRPPNTQQCVVSEISSVMPPSVDNGVEAFYNLGRLDARLTLLNGSGRYEDDNSLMDAVGQVSWRPMPHWQVRLTSQSGQQPSGQRSVRAADISYEREPVFWRGLYLERPDLSESAWLSEINVRAGPHTLVALGETINSRLAGVRRLDIGVNTRLNPGCVMRLHGVFSSAASPELVFRMQQSF
ncbi:MAG: hypothetical protein WC544_01830 [Patescibacteria group bacterium]